MSEQTFIVVATFSDGVDMSEVLALVPAEIAQVEALRSQGRLGAVHVAFTRRTTFIEAFAEDEASAVETVQLLPMAKFFDLDVFSTRPPGPPA